MKVEEYNQLRGRSGRQGDPGSTIFYKLQDELMRIFERSIDGMLKNLALKRRVD